MSQSPKKPLILWKHEPRSKNPRSLKTWVRIQNLWSSENMSQDPKILGLWKHEPRSRTFGPLKTWVKTQKPLVLWKYEPRSKNPRPLKTWARIRRPPGKHISYSFKKKKKLYELRLDLIPHKEVRRQSPSRFGPNFDPLHDHLHFCLQASYIHHG